MPSPTRPGRPAGGDSGNRERILEAAREEFAARGVHGAPMRAIAARAGVDVSLLSHYFGGKDGLFAATLELPAAAADLLAEALSGDPSGTAERLTRSYLALWERGETGPQMRGLARSAIGQEDGSALLLRQISDILAAPAVRGRVQGRESDVVLAMTTLLGVALGRHLLAHPALTALSFEELVSRTCPAVRVHLDRTAGGT